MQCVFIFNGCRKIKEDLNSEEGLDDEEGEEEGGRSLSFLYFLDFMNSGKKFSEKYKGYSSNSTYTVFDGELERDCL